MLLALTVADLTAVRMRRELALINASLNAVTQMQQQVIASLASRRLWP